MERNFIVSLAVYPFDVMFSIDQTDEELFGALKSCNLVTELEDSCKWKKDQRGYCVQFQGGQSLVRLRNIPTTPTGHAVAAHEIFHAVANVMESVGMKYKFGTSEEAFTYLIEYLTEKFYEKVSIQDEFFAIIDTSKDKIRFCYTDAKKTKGAMAIYDKKPALPKGWEKFKKIVRVIVDIK